MPNVSPRIAGAIGDCLEAEALNRVAAAETTRAKAATRLARVELEKAKREERIATSLRMRAEDHLAAAERAEEKAAQAELKLAENLRSACRRFSGIEHQQVSPAHAG